MQFMSYITRTDPETGEMTSCEGKRKIFISYKHADETKLPLCKRLTSYILDKYDVAIWYDCELTAGEEYDKEIQKAIRASDAFVWLLTPTVLHSEYIIEKEIPMALKNQVTIIPIIAGIAEEELPKVENVIGRIHMPLWFFGQRDTVPSFPNEALQQFYVGLALSIANKDLLSQAELFCKRGGHALSLRYLTLEQVFIKAYGCLFGISALGEKSLGVKLMESILISYGTDQDFKALQKEVALELLAYFYRSNQPELLFTYFKMAAAKDIEESPPAAFGRFFNGTTKWIRSIYDILFNVYKMQWHPDMLCQESELSLLLFEQCYRINWGQEWNAEDVVVMLDGAQPMAPGKYETVEINTKIGEICFEGHTAFFQKSSSDSRAVDLVVDGRRLSEFPVYASFGDVYMLYLAYDASHRMLLTLHSDFDHYGVETCTKCNAFRIDPEGIRSVSFYSEWLKYRRDLPYDPYTFNIR